MNMKYVAYLLLSCIVFFLLCNPLHLYFLSDDFDSMFTSQQWSGVIHSYRPGSDFLLHTDHLLFGYDARGYHTTNYLLHFATCFLLFYAAKELLRPFYDITVADKYAFAASVIFLYYPFHSEPIFWLVGRSSLLAVLFAMASVFCFLKKKQNIVYYFLSLFTLLLGLFSYESIWTLPAIIILLSFVYDKDVTGKARLLYVAGYWFVFFMYLWMRFRLTDTVIGSPYGTQKIVSFDVRLLLRNFLALVSRSFLPPMQSAIMYVICFTVLLLMLLGLYFTIRKRITIPLIVCTIAFLVCLLPVLSLGIDTHDTESERFLYLPSAFLSIGISIILFAVFKSKTVYALGGLLALQIVFLTMSYSSFAAASTVVKTSIKAIRSLPVTDTVVCIDLPEQYKGGFIFRNGFANAAKLFAPQVKNVVINPHKEIMQDPQKYELNNYPRAALPARKYVHHLGTDITTPVAVFIWTDSSLNVYQ